MEWMFYFKIKKQLALEFRCRMVMNGSCTRSFTETVMSDLVSRWDDFVRTPISMERLLLRLRDRLESTIHAVLTASGRGDPTMAEPDALSSSLVTEETVDIGFASIVAVVQAAPLPLDLLAGDALARLLPAEMVAEMKSDWERRKTLRRLAYDLAIQAVSDFLRLPIPEDLSPVADDAPELLTDGRQRLALLNLAKEALDRLGCTVHLLTPAELAQEAAYGDKNDEE